MNLGDVAFDTCPCGAYVLRIPVVGGSKAIIDVLLPPNDNGQIAIDQNDVAYLASTLTSTEGMTRYTLHHLTCPLTRS